MKTFFKIWIPLLLITVFAQMGKSQNDVTFIFGSGSVNQGDLINVDVTVRDFTNIIGMQYGVYWDTDQFEFVDTVLNNQVFESFKPAFVPVEGGLNFSWEELSFEPKSLNDNEVLYTLVFRAIGEECDMTRIDLDTPTNVGSNIGVEVTQLNPNQDPMIIGVEEEIGTLMINGANCGGGSDDLTLIMGDLTVAEGGSICVPISVENFTNVFSMQFTIAYDPDVLRFVNAQNFNLPNLSSGSINLDADGFLVVSWETTIDPVSLADGTVIFELCFDAIGNSGDISPLEFIDYEDKPIEIVVGESGDLIEINPTLNFGSVRIMGGTFDGVELFIGNVSGAQGTEVCVPVTVTGYERLTSLTFELNFDPEVIEFTELRNAAISQGLTSNVLNGNALRVVWSDPVAAGQTLGDNALLYDICFNIVGDCDESSTIVDNVSLREREAANVDSEVLDLRINSGSISVFCGFNPSINISNESCPSDCDGSIQLNLPGGANNFDFEWSGPSSVGNTPNATGLCAGNYSVRIIAQDGQDTTINPISVTSPNSFSIGNINVTNVVNGLDGSIALTMVGGSGDFSFDWGDNLPNSNPITNLGVGSYQVTITDNQTGCSITSDLISVNEGGDFDVQAQLSQIACADECTGRIQLIIQGGTEPYQITWEDNSNEAVRNNLCAGTYNYTVTDATGETISGSRTLENPAAFNLVNVDTECGDVGAGNGSAIINVEGGTQPYLFSFNGTDFVSNNINSNLEPGRYNAFARDARGCEILIPFRIRDCANPVDCYEAMPLITPNGDLMNDRFLIECAGDDNNTLEIFDRFGRLVFTMDNYLDQWEGQDDNGNELDEGTYIWVLRVQTLTEGEQIYKGAVSLIRTLR